MRGYTYTCNNCGHTVYTSGPHLFYRDNSGNLKPYGHPSPISEEARRRGIWGSYAILYCYRCDRTYKLVLYERGVAAQLKCPECSNTDFNFGKEGDTGITCPQCKNGKLMSKLHWMS